LLSATISILVKNKDVKQKMKKARKKLTYKEIMGMLMLIQQQINQIKQHLNVSDRALDEYVKMKGDKESFVKHLEEKYKEPETDDKDSKKIKSK
jgi:hypothetical protein